MTWIVKNVPRHTFRRNSLAVVILQLRFHPILKVTERIADFQERVRPRFPGFDAVEAQNLDVTSDGIQVRNETAHRFHAAAEPTVVALGTSSVSIEYRGHQSREVLLGDAVMVLSALEAVYAPIVPKRLGIRYVNLISKSRISSELGRSVGWGDLLTQNFAKTPGGIAELDDATTFMVEVTSPCARGRMTVRYGIVPDQVSPTLFPAGSGPPTERKFRLDTDRYIDGSFKFDEVSALASDFSEDIFQIFMTAAGPALVEWMDQGALS
ncbi:MAG TPA: TIGR04255 family protein [Kofleriaceae bacterium]|nr:TIGR04255 family protein [Kofleriaceae bacterium]